MLTIQEAFRSLYGAWRLAFMDKNALNFFDTSVAGFWRSFAAAGLIAPFYGMLMLMRYGFGEISAPLPRYLAVVAIAYVISWLAFPVAMDPASQKMNRGGKFVAFIVAYNWAAVLQSALYLPFAMLSVSGLISADAAGFFGLVILTVLFAYSWIIARTVLEVTAAQATGVVILDFALSFLINVYSEGMF
ncbi:MAG: hypothetical protein HQ504_05305 [Rhodospirillaceae bacterium]|nr:hypothetical protein [Rhodospirillaceae bacterium]